MNQCPEASQTLGVDPCFYPTAQFRYVVDAKRARYQCNYWSGSAVLGLNAGHTTKNSKDYLIGTLYIGWSALSQVFRIRMVGQPKTKKIPFHHDGLVQ